MTTKSKTKRKTTLPLVKITWGDAYMESGWMDSDDDIKKDHKAAECFSWGLMAKKDKKGITLLGASSPDEHARIGGGAKQFIPAGMVKKIEVIRKETLG